MLPFDNYPAFGRQLLGRAPGANCRREYGLAFMRRTGQTRCAYCGVDFSSTYETWLTMALDHVVPASVCKALQVPDDWREDCANRALACAACNGFRNRYAPTFDVVLPLTLDTFFDLRDRIFAERKDLITASHVAERTFFDDRPWELSSNS